MDSMACATLDTKTGNYSFSTKLAKEAPSDRSNIKSVADIIGGIEPPTGISVDQGMLQYMFCDQGTLQRSGTAFEKRPGTYSHLHCSQKLLFLNAAPTPSDIWWYISN
jgi:hypothetical protein